MESLKQSDEMEYKMEFCDFFIYFFFNLRKDLLINEREDRKHTLITKLWIPSSHKGNVFIMVDLLTNYTNKMSLTHDARKHKKLR